MLSALYTQVVMCDKVTNVTISQMLSGTITARVCFTRESEVLFVDYTESDGQTAEWKMLKSIDPQVLPDEDFYVKHAGCLLY